MAKLNLNYKLNDLLLDLVNMGGTDLQLTVGDFPKVKHMDSLHPLKQYGIITPEIMDKLIMDSGLLDLLANVDFSAQGSHDCSYSLKQSNGTMLYFRVNLFKDRNGNAGTFRALGAKIRAFEQLGLPVELNDLYKYRKGLILVVGTTGSGKSTTLASLLDYINKQLAKKIITIEDPIEYRYTSERSSVSQREVGKHTTCFAQALKDSLRECPDVILVGEIRDGETASIALEAAETGHLVCSTLHTGSAADTIRRLTTMVPADRRTEVLDILAGTLVCVIAQQLVPKVVKEGEKPEYVLAYEVLRPTPEVKELIRQDKVSELDAYMYGQQARIDRQYAMDEVLFRKYAQGLISEADALDFSNNKNRMRDYISQMHTTMQ